MSLSEAEARSVLQQVIRDWWAERGYPLVGSQLKARVLQRTPDFDERALGYRNFAAFVRDTDGVAIKFRERSDFAVTPAEHAAVLEEPSEKRMWVRPDFWQAFVSFAIQGQIRAYDRTHDRIVKGPQESIPQGAIVITPIPMEEQLSWRRHFIEGLGADSPLREVLPNLHSDSGLKIFSSGLGSHADLRRRWNIVWVKHIATYVRAWAEANEIAENMWLTTSPGALEQSGDLRKRVYALLDKIPVEHLLELKIPVRWLLDVPGTEEQQHDS